MVVMQANASAEDVNRVVNRIRDSGLQAYPHRSAERMVVGIGGNIQEVGADQLMQLPGVTSIVPIQKPYKLTSRDFHPERSCVQIGDVHFDDKLVIIAGPCAIEGRNQALETAHAVHEAGAHILRGGAYKPRTSPYSFQGLGERGLEMLAEAGEATGMPTVTEILDTKHVDLVTRYTDMLQIGARNMQNYALLHAVGESLHPVLLKRGSSATIHELLMAAEYILSHGNNRVVLCERGIRTFETATRNTTDINAIPVLKAHTHLPIILDPSHSTGHWEYVQAIACAGAAAGADGLMIEVHNNPCEALSDGFQSLKPERFAALIQQVNRIYSVVNCTAVNTPQPGPNVAAAHMSPACAP